MRIDFHTHCLARECFDLMDSNGHHYGPSIVVDDKGRECVVLGGVNGGPVARQLYDAETRIKDMDAAGIDVQVLTPIPRLFYYELETERCLWYTRRQNDGTARMARESSGRFIGMATVPLQDPKAAVAELNRAVNQMGLRGVEIQTTINGRELDDPSLEPFYREVEALDVPVLVHPWVYGTAARMGKYYLYNLVGNPWDTTLAAANLIFGGILEKFPDIKFCLSHGGGNLPYLRGRLERGFEVRPECKVAVKQPPSHYIPRLYYDSITHFVPALQYLVSTTGADKVLMGTDYPYDMADFHPVQSVQSLGISEEDKEKMLGGNASRLLKLEASSKRKMRIGVVNG